MKIINFETKKTKQNKRAAGIIQKCKNLALFVKKKMKIKYLNDKNYCKVKDHCHFTKKYGGASLSICNLKYIVPKNSYNFS